MLKNQNNIACLGHSKDKEYVVSDICGASWWASLEGIAQAIYNKGCSVCGADAINLINFLHDMVNVKLDKPVFDKDNFKKYFPLAEKTYIKAGGKKVNLKNSSTTEEEIIIRPLVIKSKCSLLGVHSA